MRHLSRQQAETYLRLGKWIEQWLGVRRDDGLDVHRWVTVHRDHDRYVVTLLDGIDAFEGSAETDLYLLYSRHSDEDGAAQSVLDGAVVSEHADASAAVDHVVHVLGGSADRFVNRTFVQDEYRDWNAAQTQKP